MSGILDEIAAIKNAIINRFTSNLSEISSTTFTRVKQAIEIIITEIISTIDELKLFIFLHQ